MKKKTKKEEKNTLPITQAEYSEAMVLILFVAEIKKNLEKIQGTSDVRFVPKTQGYNVYYKLDGKDFKIAIQKKTLSSGYKAEKFVDGFRKASASFKSAEQYSSAIAKIFDSKTKK